MTALIILAAIKNAVAAQLGLHPGCWMAQPGTLSYQSTVSRSGFPN